MTTGTPMPGWAAELGADIDPKFIQSLLDKSLFAKKDLIDMYAMLLREAWEAATPKEQKKLKKRVQRHMQKLLQAQCSRDTAEAVDGILLNAERQR